MKKTIIVISLIFILILPVKAQWKIYLPIIFKDGIRMECDRTWRIVKPTGTRNFIDNPSAEATGSFSAVGGATVTRVTTFSHYGLYSYRIQTSGNNEGIRLSMDTLGNDTHFMTMRVRGKLPIEWDWELDSLGALQPTLIESLDDDWNLYGIIFPAALSNTGSDFYVRQVGIGSGDFYIDGIQIEQNTTWTMYCDGTQPGCEWNGTEHDDNSSRSAVSRAGGEIQDLWDEYGFFAEEIIGAGAAVQKLNVRSYATLPGGELSGSKTEPREFTIIGRFIGNSEIDLHNKRQELLEELSTDTYPESQPLLINFTGAEVQKQISAFYQGGLEGDIKVSIGDFQVESEDAWIKLSHWTERVPIRFLSPDPFWYEIGESSTLLDTNDSDTFNSIAGRLRSTGQWDALSVGTAPATSSLIWTIVEGPDKRIYIGGSFTDWDGVVGRDYIAVYTPSADSWATVGSLGDFNNDVEGLAFGPDGTLYAVGLFTNVAGVAAADYIAQWDGTNWTAVGTPNAGAAAITDIIALDFDTDGNLYVGGLFTNLANIADADYFAQWDGSAWNAIGSGGTGQINAIAIDSKDNIYIGGNFANWAGDADADLMAVWDGTSWSALSNWSFSAGVAVRALITTEDDTLYIGGDVSDMGGVANAEDVAGFNGTSIFALGPGLSGGVTAMAYYNGSLYVVGGFGSIPTVPPTSLAARIAKWNGASWSWLDGAFTLANTYFSIAVVNPDPVVIQNVDIYVNTRNPGTSNYGGIVTVTNNGTARGFPTVKFNRSGGTTARILTVRNEITGKEILLFYALLDGETLTIDLSPTNKSVISDFFGSRLEAILANSDFGSFSLLPDNNSVTSFVDTAGGPTITAWMLWKDKYKSFD